VTLSAGPLAAVPGSGPCAAVPDVRPDAGSVAGAFSVAVAVAGAAGSVWMRQADHGDRAALEAMFLRCTPQTVYRRFHGPVKAFPRSYLTEALARIPEHLGLVASPAQGGSLVGLASCRLTDSGDAAELGLLVEDGWQGRGLGRELLRRLVAYADGLRVPELRAQVLIEQDWIIGMLRPYGQCSSVFRLGIREVRVQRKLRPA
jgi:GNAT superfamily N-acetyltransferase